MTRRQRIAIQNPCALADQTIDQCFMERYGKYFTVFTINK